MLDKLAIRSSSSRVADDAARVVCEEISSVSPGNPVSVLVSFTVMTTFLGPAYMTSLKQKYILINE